MAVMSGTRFRTRQRMRVVAAAAVVAMASVEVALAAPAGAKNVSASQETALVTEGDTTASPDNGVTALVADQLRRANAANSRFVAAQINSSERHITLHIVGSTDLKDVSTEGINLQGVTLSAKAALVSNELEEQLFAALKQATPGLRELGVRPNGIGVMGLGQAVTFMYDDKGRVPTHEDLRQLAMGGWPPEVFDPRYVVFVPDRAVPFGGNRTSVQSPLDGGARIHGPSQSATDGYYSQCTSGYSVKSTEKPGYWLTTAAHCEHPDNNIFYNQWYKTNNFAIGGVSSKNEQYDTAMIKVGSSRIGEPYIFVGALGNSTQKMRVVNASKIVKGDEYCASGAQSYNRCGGIVAGPQADIAVENLYSGDLYGIDGFLLQHPTGQWLAASGDSGGPVYSFEPGGQTINARGAVSAGFYPAQVPCPASFPSDVWCSSKLLITPISVLEDPPYNLIFVW